MRGRKPAREPKMEPQENLSEIEVEEIVVSIVPLPTEENPLATIINKQAQRLWHINGRAQITNAAILELMAKLGSFTRIKHD